MRAATREDGRPAFVGEEIGHFEDVGHGPVFCWPRVAGHRPIGRRADARPRPMVMRRGLIAGTRLTVALFAATGALMLIGFDAFFDAFHWLFFDGEPWRLPYYGTVRSLYPGRVVGGHGRRAGRARARPGRGDRGLRAQMEQLIAQSSTRIASDAPRRSATRWASCSRPARATRRNALDGDLGFAPLRLDPPQARKPAVLQHGARARHGPEHPLAQGVVGREQRPVGLLQVGIPGRDQADPGRGRRRVERVRVRAQHPGPALAHGDLVEVLLELRPEPLGV